MARIRTIKPVILIDESLKPGDLHYSVYCISEHDCHESGPVKIGIATDINKRMSSLQGGNWRPLVVCWQIKLADRELAKMTEQYCLRRNKISVYDQDYINNLMSEWVDKAPTIVLGHAKLYLNASEIALVEVSV